MECFTIDKQLIDCFLSDEFCYSGRDWSSGQRWSITLKESKEYLEKLKKLNGEKKYLDFKYN